MENIYKKFVKIKNLQKQDLKFYWLFHMKKSDRRGYF
ncbi:MAG: hypothetical protein CM15mP36_13170 [Flavobacteriales bacterium]|nr:MAG: hypothetical protein CM15mP36_13170 [Flavobacteriales bacterium]